MISVGRRRYRERSADRFLVIALEGNMWFVDREPMSSQGDAYDDRESAFDNPLFWTLLWPLTRILPSLTAARHLMVPLATRPSHWLGMHQVCASSLCLGRLPQI